jgi:general secretion pathway protein K
MKRKHARGMAVIVAMLVAALAAAVAVSVATAQAQWSSQVAHRRDQVQAQSIALAGIQWARQILDADARAGPIDHLGEPWALPLPATPVENGVVEGRIVDAQASLNANDLTLGAHTAFERRRFERLFALLGVDASLLGRIAAKAPATQVQELAYVNGMTAAVLARVARFVTTLPVETPLNVNTAPAELLAASLGGIEPRDLAALVASRAQQPFATLADFRERLPSGATLGDEAAYSVSSRFFLVSVQARQGETIARARALIERGNGRSPSVVWQTIE